MPAWFSNVWIGAIPASNSSSFLRHSTHSRFSSIRRYSLTPVQHPLPAISCQLRPSSDAAAAIEIPPSGSIGLRTLIFSTPCLQTSEPFSAAGYAMHLPLADRFNLRPQPFRACDMDGSLSFRGWIRGEIPPSPTKSPPYSLLL